MLVASGALAEQASGVRLWTRAWICDHDRQGGGGARSSRGTIEAGDVVLSIPRGVYEFSFIVRTAARVGRPPPLLSRPP